MISGQYPLKLYQVTFVFLHAWYSPSKQYRMSIVLPHLCANASDIRSKPLDQLNDFGDHLCMRTNKLIRYLRPGPEVIKLFSCSTRLSTKFILLINVKMPIIVGILTFIGLINTTSEKLKARNLFICRYFSFCEQLKLLAQLS